MHKSVEQNDNECLTSISDCLERCVSLPEQIYFGVNLVLDGLCNDYRQIEL